MIYKTIRELVSHYKKTNPESYMAEYWVRDLVRTNQINYFKSGTKVLISIEHFDEFLKNGCKPTKDKEQEIEKWANKIINEVNELEKE